MEDMFNIIILVLAVGGAAAVVLTCLRLCKKITWKWRWVLSPAWIAAGLVLLYCLLVGIGMLLMAFGLI